MSEFNKKKCYACVHRRELVWSAHSKCTHPDKESIEIEGHEVGKKRGWFSWPVNFDPVWLIKCSGFQESPKDEQ